jgi:hypothetical protein
VKNIKIIPYDLKTTRSIDILDDINVIKYSKAMFCPTCEIIHNVNKYCPKCAGESNIGLHEMITWRNKIKKEE